MAGEVAYGVDGHKLSYHPERVAQWLAEGDTRPIYLEVGPAARCFQSCCYCAFDYLKSSGPILDGAPLRSALADAASHGLRSVMFAGEGEPLLHPEISELVGYSAQVGLKVAITTNGVLFRPPVAEACLPHLAWIRFSLDAATKETYDRIHRGGPRDWEKVKENIRYAVQLKRERGYSCTIGTQALLIPQNQAEVPDIIRLARDLGADYLAIKPYSQHPLSIHQWDIDYSRPFFWEQGLSSLETDSFKVIYRRHTMQKLQEPRPYLECLGLPFITYIAATGDVYVCSAFLGNQDFLYGNILEATFSSIWKGERRQQVLARVKAMGVEPCREVCRLDEINRYLWALKHPEMVPHMDFV